MPSLHWADASISPTVQISEKTLHLTRTLLRQDQPELAAQLGTLLKPSLSAKGEHGIALDGHTAVCELGAVAIGRIIAALTELGNRWLQARQCSRQSLHNLQKILDEWIALGEWVVHNASP